MEEEELVEKIFKRYDIDYAVNFAGEPHVDRSIAGPRVLLEANILGTQNLLDVGKSFGQQIMKIKDILSIKREKNIFRYLLMRYMDF